MDLIESATSTRSEAMEVGAGPAFAQLAEELAMLSDSLNVLEERCAYVLRPAPVGEQLRQVTPSDLSALTEVMIAHVQRVSDMRGRVRTLIERLDLPA